MTVPIALYLNLENTLIPRTMFAKLLSDGKESYSAAIRSMDPRVHLVAPAKDWIILAIANPGLIDFMKDKGLVILPTLFSHVLPDLFPETLEMQYALSSMTIERLFEKISWNGIIPENTLGPVIVPFAEKHWEGAILSVGHNNSRGLQPGYYEIGEVAGNRLPLKVVANASARLKYMRMYREETSVSSVLSDMSGDDHMKACLFDFERPWSNVVYYPHFGKSVARLDVWRKFHRRLSSEEVSSWNLADTPSRPLLFLDKADLDLWENKESRWLIEIQKEIVHQCLGRGDYFEFAALAASSCMPPRVLTRFLQDDSFPSTHNGKPGVVDLVGDVSKVKETLFTCKNIRQKRRVDYGAEFLPKGERLYLELLHKTLVWLDRHIS